MAGTSDDSTEEPIGQHLINLGWQQGVLIQAASLLDASSEGADLRTFAVIKPEARIVIVSQTCDIVAATDREPIVEGLICEVDAQRVTGRLLRSSRFFPIDVNANLVAFASKRVLIPKPILRGVRPDGIITDKMHRSMFSRWLADRWRRADFPDEFNTYFTSKLDAEIRSTRTKAPEAWGIIKTELYQFRALCERNDAGNVVDVQLRALVRPSNNAGYLRAIRNVVDPVIEEVNDAGHTPLRIGRLGIYTPANFSLADAWLFRPVDFDYLSIDGDERGLWPDGPE